MLEGRIQLLLPSRYISGVGGGGGAWIVLCRRSTSTRMAARRRLLPVPVLPEIRESLPGGKESETLSNTNRAGWMSVSVSASVSVRRTAWSWWRSGHAKLALSNEIVLPSSPSSWCVTTL